MIFDAFFESLPFVPLIDICKHLDLFQVIPCSQISERWKKAIEAGSGSRSRRDLFLDFHTKPDSYSLILKSCRPASTRNRCDIGVEMKYGVVAVEQPPNPDSFYFFPFYTFVFHSEQLENLQKMCLEMVIFVCKVFCPAANMISLIVTEKSLGFTDKLISLIPSGKGQWLEIKKDEEVVLRGETISKLLENTSFAHHVFIDPEFDNACASDKIYFDVATVKVKDARFLNRNTLVNMQIRNGEFGTNVLTSGDFNAFLKSWQQFQPSDEASQLKKVTFVISDNQPIDMDKVVEGLNARPWDQRVRDRTMYQRRVLVKNEQLNLKDGMDVRNVSGALGTVRLTDNQLMFITWEHCFPVAREERRIGDLIQSWQQRLSQNQKDLEQIEEKLISDKENEELLMDKKRYENWVGRCQEYIKFQLQLLEELKEFK